MQNKRPLRVQKNPFVFTCFCASTANITRDDDQVLKDVGMDRVKNIGGFPIVDISPYGYWIYIPEQPEEEASSFRDIGLSEAFINLLGRGRDNDCRYLLIDCDGPIVEDLPQFDW